MEIVELYLAGARAVREAVTDAAVVAAWDEPSALEEQTVGSLAGHLARTGTWIVDEFLAAGEPAQPVDFETVGEFYVALLPFAEHPIHQAIRDRGAALAAQGSAALASMIDERMPAVEAQLRAMPPDRTLEVTGGNVMTIDRYLVTRVVEQVVHLDDLARSVGREPWPLPEDAYRLVADVALDVAFRRHQPELVVRGLYRRGHTDAVFPAI